MQAKLRNWDVKQVDRDNPLSENRSTNSVYMMEVWDKESGDLLYQSKHQAATKVAGRQTCAFDILTRIFGRKKLWQDLVEETRKWVDDERDKRGAPDKPVLLQKRQYLEQQRQMIEQRQAQPLCPSTTVKPSLLLEEKEE